jgi:uncharacterized protein (AIM24 family)
VTNLWISTSSSTRRHRRKAATVAWSGNVSPGTNRDLNIKSFLGKSSGETFQLDFAQEGGFVIVQLFEEQTPAQ